MLNRRNFVAYGIALAAASARGTRALAAGREDPPRRLVRPELFVADIRFDAAVRAARHAALDGVPVAPFSGDPSALWYDELDLRWKRGPMIVAGVTTRGGLFVFETLAADRSMRVAYRGEIEDRDGHEPLCAWTIVPRARTAQVI